MGKRKRVGIFYTYNDNWAGGTYYIHNLLQALNIIPHENKPIIYVIATLEDYQQLVEISNYPFLKHHWWKNTYTLPERILNKISRMLVGYNWIEHVPNDNYYDVIFPCPNLFLLDKLPAIDNKLCWIPDFQEDRMPEFFKQEEIDLRKDSQVEIAEKAKGLVFSSHDAYNDFCRLYPIHQCQKYILQFTVHHPPYQHLNIDALRKQYQLPQDYFFVANQFWKHKNHYVVLKAIETLKKAGQPVAVAFSGKPHDYRNPEYYDDIQAYINRHQLHDCTYFLGFIPRDHQLQLMRHALAVIQPSFFEGWSTVVEDVKSMGQRLIVSNINVHQEQLLNYNSHILFDPNNDDELAEGMKQVKKLPTSDPEVYKGNIKAFAFKFMDIINDFSDKKVKQND